MNYFKEQNKFHKTPEELEREIEEWVAKGMPEKKRKYKKIDPRFCGSGRLIPRDYPEGYFN